MLTEKDIENLKNYLGLFDEFCKNHSCDDCIIYIQSKKLNISCFNAFVKSIEDLTIN